MRTIASAPVLAAALGVAVYGVGLAAQQPASSADQVHSHEAMDHAAAHASESEGPADYLTFNVSVSDVAIEPSAIFVPAGRPVQLLLRNRGTTEHHYRVVGLAADELWWVSEGESAGPEGASDEGHDHHNRAFATSRATSPQGITPTGDAVHAYVSGARGLDVVLFTATQIGTYVVQCDLHPEKTGRLVVFDSTPQIAPVLAPGRQALLRALTRDLGSVDYPGVPGVLVEATYAPAEYAAQILGGSEAVSALEADRHVAVLLTERVHSANLPALGVDPPHLFVNGSRLPVVDWKVVSDSPHHRATFYRFTPDDTFGAGHQVMTVRLAGGQEATWHLPLLVPDMGAGGGTLAGFGEQWGLILALLGGMVAAMWPCLFQLTVYFIPALAGVAMQDAGGSKSSRRRQVLQAAFFFILGFTVLYTATGALIGFAAQRLGDTAQFDVWQRYFGVAAGVVVIGLALRVAAKVRAPLVCRMPVLSGMASSGKPATRLEMMVAGVAFATGCMTCFGSALVVGMVVYIGLAQSAFYGALVLFLFSLGMGVPLVIAAMAMAKALPFLLKLERAVPWMGLFSAVLMAGFGVLLISGNYMAVAEWTQRAVSGSMLVPTGAGGLVLVSVAAVSLGCAGWVIWLMANGRSRRSGGMSLRMP